MTFSQWSNGYGGSLTANGDDDGDGISNALEYALSLNPMVRNANAFPAGQLITDGGQTYLAITFRHRPAADLTTVVETSDNLSSWGTTPSVVMVSNTDHLDGTFTTTWRNASPAVGAAKQFLRIHTTVAP